MSVESRLRNASAARLPIVALGLVALVMSHCLAVSAAAASAAQRAVAVLDFELHDLTLDPGIAAERSRTASIAPQLRRILDTRYGFRPVSIGSQTQEAADEAFGYLFDHHDEAAKLGREAASDWIVVGRVHKASFLFVYFKARVIDTRTNRLIADLTVEVKGTEERLTAKGVETLATQIAAAINEETQQQ